MNPRRLRASRFVKLLLDAMMPSEIAGLLVGHDVSHPADRGWRMLNNGKLPAASEAGGFDVLITKDVNMPYQQNMRGRTIALVALRPKSQDMEDLLVPAPQVLQALSDLLPGSVISIPRS